MKKNIIIVLSILMVLISSCSKNEVTEKNSINTENKQEIGSNIINEPKVIEKEIKEERSNIEITNSILEKVDILDVNIHNNLEDQGKLNNNLSILVEKEIKKILDTEHSEKYNLDCDLYKTKEGKNICFKVKIESHMFYLFKGLEGDEKYKLNCSEKFSIENWSEIPKEAKEYQQHCEKEMKPHYEIYEEKKEDLIIDKQAKQFTLSSCDNMIKTVYSDLDTSEKETILNECKILYIIKKDLSCSELLNSDDIIKCENIKNDIEDYIKMKRREQVYYKYVEQDFSTILKGEW